MTRNAWNPPSLEREAARGEWRDDQLERRVPGDLGELPTIRIHGSCTIPWSFNAAATIVPFPNLDVANGGFLNAKFHNLAVGQVQQRIYETDGVEQFMEPTTECGNPSGIGTYCFWAVSFIEPGIYVATLQAGGSGGDIAGSGSTTRLFPTIEAVVLQSRPVLQSRHFHTHEASATGRVAAEYTFVVEQDDIDTAGNINYVAGSVRQENFGAVDRGITAEFRVVRLGDIGDLDLVYEYEHA